MDCFAWMLVVHAPQLAHAGPDVKAALSSLQQPHPEAKVQAFQRGNGAYPWRVSVALQVTNSVQWRGSCCPWMAEEE